MTALSDDSPDAIGLESCTDLRHRQVTTLGKLWCLPGVVLGSGNLTDTEVQAGDVAAYPVQSSDELVDSSNADVHALHHRVTDGVKDVRKATDHRIAERLEVLAPQVLHLVVDRLESVRPQPPGDPAPDVEHLRDAIAHGFDARLDVVVPQVRHTV